LAGRPASGQHIETVLLVERKSFAAIAPGFFAPVSHFWMVDGLVFR
jgi:hypothetical protein